MTTTTRTAFGGTVHPDGAYGPGGLTMLDLFACHALTGLLAAEANGAVALASDNAKTAYLIAAAMLAERNRRIAAAK